MNFKERISEIRIPEGPLIFVILAIALIIRLLHFISAVNNPITYFPGADETFYLNFAMDVSHGHLGFSSQYIFMDPLYGYFLGILTWAAEKNVFIIYVIQIIIDVVTVWVIYVIGRLAWNPRAGLIAAMFYALSTTAIFYTTTILKPTLVANYIALWILFSIKVSQSKSLYIWLSFGIFIGLGVALRSNLLILSLASFIILPSFYIKYYGLNNISIKMLFLMIGFILITVLLAERNEKVTNYWSILPPNSGIVLHQIYNSDNPRAVQFSPEFISYGSPHDILYGYTKEAEKRLGEKLSVYEVSHYWREEAVNYINRNPTKVLENILRKSKEFIAYKEIDNSRSLNKEAKFSPILTLLPQSLGWLSAFGIPGLIILFIRNKIISLPIIIAMGTVFLTFIIFIAAARFRAHGLPLFAIGSGVFISSLMEWKNNDHYQHIIAIIFSVVLGFLTVVYGNQMEETDNNPIQIAWGYLKMGQVEAAEQYALDKIHKEPKDASPYELLGYISLNENDYEKAISYLSNAARLAPQHHVTQYNLAIAYREEMQLQNSLIAIEAAINNVVLPDYLYLKGQILEQIGAVENARSNYEFLIDIAASRFEWHEYIIKAEERLSILKN